MKRIVALLLVCVMSFAFSACGNQTAQEGKTDSDLDYVKNKGEMIIGYTLFAPMNYKDDNNKLIGFETEFAEALCERLGVKPVFQEIDWDSKEVELNSKNIDCIWNGMSITDERKQNMSVSDPYMNNRQVLIVRKGDVDKYKSNIDGAAVVAEKGSVGEEVIETNEFFKNAKYTALDSQAKGLVEVKAGTSDIVVTDYVLACGSIGEGTDYKELAIIDKDFEPECYGVAFRKGSDVTAEFNKIVKEMMQDGALQKIAAKYKLEDLLVK